MATLNIMYGIPGRGNRTPSAWETVTSAENVTTSGTAASGAVSANDNAYARCKASGGGMYVKPILSGATAVAVGTGALLGDGDVLDVRVPNGWRISVIDA
jgi:hypothetical protein